MPASPPPAATASKKATASAAPPWRFSWATSRSRRANPKSVRGDSSPTRLYPFFALATQPGAESVACLSIRLSCARLRRAGDRVLEFVGMFAVHNRDHHRAREAGQLAGAGIGDDGDRQLWCPPRHGTAVLEHEAAAAALQGPAHPLDGDIAGGALDARADGQHLALAGAFEIAAKLLIDQQPAHHRA